MAATRERDPLPQAPQPAADLHRVAASGQHGRRARRAGRAAERAGAPRSRSGPTPAGCRMASASLGFDIGPTETPIVPVLIGPLEKTFLMWRRLFDAGVFTNPVAPPAVPDLAVPAPDQPHGDAHLRPDRFRARAVRPHRPGAGGHLTPAAARPRGAGPTGPQALHRPPLPTPRAGPDLGPAVASGRRRPPLPHQEPVLRARRSRIFPRRARRGGRRPHRGHQQPAAQRDPRRPGRLLRLLRVHRRPGGRRRAVRRRGRNGAARGGTTCSAGPAPSR